LPPLEDVIMGKNTAIKKIMKGDKALLKKSGVRQKSFHSLEKAPWYGFLLCQRL